VVWQVNRGLLSHAHLSCHQHHTPVYSFCGRCCRQTRLRWLRQSMRCGIWKARPSTLQCTFSRLVAVESACGVSLSQACIPLHSAAYTPRLACSTSRSLVRHAHALCRVFHRDGTHPHTCFGVRVRVRSGEDLANRSRAQTLDFKSSKTHTVHLLRFAHVRSGAERARRSKSSKTHDSATCWDDASVGRVATPCVRENLVPLLQIDRRVAIAHHVSTETTAHPSTTGYRPPRLNRIHRTPLNDR
jgi:hypothetical protein